MSATAARRLERRDDLLPGTATNGSRRPATRAATRPVTRGAQRPGTRATTRPATRETARPVAGQATRTVTRATSRPEPRTSARPATRPQTRAQTGTTTRPAARPSSRPATRSAARPAARPDTRPATRPDTRPATRPDSRRALRPVESPRRLRKRPEHRPLPPALEAVARTQLFRSRVETTAEIERREGRRSHLRLVPRRRRIAAILAPALVVVFLAMLGVTTFQTRMAEKQVELDRLLVKVDRARDANLGLSRQRAELLSPTRLGEEAARMKMVSPDTVGFVSVGIDDYRAVLEGSGAMANGALASRPVGANP